MGGGQEATTSGGDTASARTPANFPFDRVAPFDFGAPAQWPHWIRHFKRLMVATRLDEETPTRQVATLLSSLPHVAEDILSQSTLTDAQKNDFDQVVTVFENHCVGRRNVIFERARFGQRVQGPAESVEDFVTALHTLAEHCGYGNMREEIIRDRFVLGIRDKKLSEQLQMDPDLTLSTAINKAKVKQDVAQQNKELLQGSSTAHSSSAQPAAVEPVGRPKQHRRRQGPPRSKGQPSSTGQVAGKQHGKSSCGYCGSSRNRHPREQCPARGEECHRCGKKGHFGKVCRSKPRISTVDTHPVAAGKMEEQWAYISALNDEDIDMEEEPPWKEPVEVNGRDVLFKLDTGADVSAVPSTQKGIPRRLQPAPKKLIAAGGHVCKVRGVYNASLRHLHTTIRELIYVVDWLSQPLLSRQACVRLHLVKRVEVVSMAPRQMLGEDSFKQDGGNLKHIPPHILKEFPSLFTGLGTIPGDYTIQLTQDAIPFSIPVARRLPLPLVQPTKKVLDTMERLGVIYKVEVPTRWTAPIVVIPKNVPGQPPSVRICSDYTMLNQYVLRERFILPDVEETLARLGEARVYTKLDANSGFHQCPLAEESQLLTTFITPFGRYAYRRLPFGISSAPEIFHRKMTQLLDGLEGVFCHMDDVLILGRTQQEHDERLQATLNRLQHNGVTLNPAKCTFSQPEIVYLGHRLKGGKIFVDKSKVQAIVDMPAPTNVTEVRRFIGMVQYLGRFLPGVSQKLIPLQLLTHDDTVWTWDADQKKAFAEVKEAVANAITLASFRLEDEVIVMCDSSSVAMGCVLMQRSEDGELRVISTGSRMLTKTQQRYSQLEKEALAVVFACKKFRKYLIGLRRRFIIQTDHRPLLTLLVSKDIDLLPPRIQRFRLYLTQYYFTMQYVPGKMLIPADTLSRAVPASNPTPDEELDSIADLAELWLDSEVAFFHEAAPATFLQRVRQAQQEDSVCQQLLSCFKQKWPSSRKLCPPNLTPFWEKRAFLHQMDGLLFMNKRLVIPPPLQKEVLGRIHEGHQGERRCRQRAQETVWWPGLSTQLTNIVKNCQLCIEHRRPPTPPMIHTPVSQRPWQTLGADIFLLHGKAYLLVVDYYSHYPELEELRRMTAAAVIAAFQGIYSRHGFPQTLRTDSGTNFLSAEFQQFCSRYDVEHIAASPGYQQSNGEAERTIQTIKTLLQKSSDPWLALLIYRSTPTSSGYSPSELLMSRKLKSNLPMVPSMLVPKVVDRKKFRKGEEERRRKQARDYNKRHRVTPEQQFKVNDKVWVPDVKQWGTVVQVGPEPRSYLVQTDTRRLRRTVRMLLKGPEEPHDVDLPDATPETPREPPPPPLRPVQPPPQLQSPASRPPSLSPAVGRSGVQSPIAPSSTPGRLHGQDQPPTGQPSSPAGYTTRSGRVVVPTRRYKP